MLSRAEIPVQNKEYNHCSFVPILFNRGPSELLSPVVRDEVVTIAARRRKKVACILHLKALFMNAKFTVRSTTYVSYLIMKLHDQKEGQNCCFPELSSVPSPGGESPVNSMVTPARPFVKNTPASLYRQAGKNHRSCDWDAELLHHHCTGYWC